MKLLTSVFILLAIIQVALSLHLVQNGPVHKGRSDMEATAINCTTCKKYMGKFYEAIELHLKTLKPDIIKIIEDICKTSAGKDSSMCKDAIDDFPDFIIKKLREILNPYGFCPAAEYCPKGAHENLETDGVAGNDECTQCQDFFGDARQKVIKNGEVDVAVADEFHKACDSFCALGFFCYEMVKDFFPVMLRKLAVLAPDDLTGCKALGYCSASEKKRDIENEGLVVKLFQSPMSEDTAPTCADCREFMGKVYEALEKGVTAFMPLIAAKVSEVCSLAGPDADMCRDGLKDFPKVWVPDLITLLNPYFFCPEAKYCPTSGYETSLQLQDQQPPCERCKAFFTDVSQRIGRDIQIDVAISKQLEKTCDGFCSLASWCKKAVESYTPTMIQTFPSTLANPNEICAQLKYCSAERTADMPNLVSNMAASMEKQEDLAMSQKLNRRKA
ncbi:uncharacterized protein LOC119731467 isoform X2 [Patiria miniata]|uniref:Saposin B-type domain-containing protein n=1 Tax=Patiria miniata TaxID=46514 RepID=A0A914A9Q0_PATMI|nr:uncharacterized protein LOC119731467 isoform X2 [Patiria miniata]